MSNYGDVSYIFLINTKRFLVMFVWWFSGKNMMTVLDAKCRDGFCSQSVARTPGTTCVAATKNQFAVTVQDSWRR